MELTNLKKKIFTFVIFNYIRSNFSSYFSEKTHEVIKNCLGKMLLKEYYFFHRDVIL